MSRECQEQGDERWRRLAGVEERGRKEERVVVEVEVDVVVVGQWGFYSLLLGLTFLFPPPSISLARDYHAQ